MRMERITFECEVITPMFLAGADGKTPELRAPSLKGLMRFWWRALHGNLDLKQLREQEAQIFGTADEKIGRSKFSLRIIPDGELQVGEFQPLPHHTGSRKGFSLFAVKPGMKFKIKITSLDEEILKKMENLIKASLVLAGLGKRSRRGFGSVKISLIHAEKFNFDCPLQSICDLLNQINPSFFEINDATLKSKFNSNCTFPYVQEIRIGKGKNLNYGDLLKKIGKSSHEHQSDYTGYARDGKRFASPVWVTVIQEKDQYLPIVTRLCNTLASKLKNLDHSEEFIKDILE